MLIIGASILAAIIIITGIILLRHPNFWVGALMAFAVVLLSAGLFWQGLDYVLNLIAARSMILGLSLLFIIVLALAGLFFGFIIYLIRNTSIMSSREGRSLTSRLSAMLGANLIILMPAMWLMIRATTRLTKIPLAIFVWEDLFFSSLFLCYLIYSALNQFFNRPTQIDYLIVLGAWSGKKGQIPPLLKGRVDEAVIYYRRNGGQPKFVVSGGQGPDETISEAAAMRDYLLSLGISNEQIIVEDQSRNTLQNMQFSKRLIEADWQGAQPPKIVFSTNNYHVLRALLYARKAGLPATGVGSPTSFFFLPSALIREFIALLNYYRKTTIVVAFLIAIIMTWSFWHVAS
ncbi:YdcF family protein [Furfurilactobacillus curtus]|uniref:Membrane protein n=1 Tax=Furfurilactobacillus curtus TaxID=1746200 RepID=A0ABQ5JVE4_9LACO